MTSLISALHLSWTSWWRVRYSTTHFRVVEEVYVPASRKSNRLMARSSVLRPPSSSMEIR